MKKALLVLGLCAVLAPVAASQYFDTQALAAANAEAKSHLQKAFAARTADDFAKMLQEYKLALEIQPEALDIHKALLMDVQNGVGMASYQLSTAKERQLKAAAAAPDSKSGESGPDVAALEDKLKQRREVLRQVSAQYETWMKQYPNKAIYPYLLGKSMEWAEVEKQEPLLQRAIALDPKYVPALQYMSDVKGWLDEKDAAVEYMKKVVDLKPGDDETRILYAAKLREVNPGAANKVLEEVLARNPANAVGVRAATGLVSACDKPADKIAAVERALRQFPLEKFREMQMPIFSSLEAYAVVDPARGLELARALQSASKNERYFTPRVDYLNAIVQSKNLTVAGQSAEAYSVLEKVEAPAGMKSKPLILAKANAAQGAGKSPVAHEILLKNFAETADSEVGDALAKAASALGKSQDDVSNDVWASRNAKAYRLKDLPLKRLENDQQFRISDFKGKVVLLSFWHPG